MRNKKGSMELGINAIVVLIIALALLGLGIGFVTKLFTSSQAKIVKIIDRTDLPIHADALNQIVFDTSTVTVKPGTSQPLIVSVFNDGIANVLSASVVAGDCVDSTGAPSSGVISIASPAQSIPANTDVGFSVAVTVPSPTAIEDTYICTVHSEFWDEQNGYHNPSKQLFIQVQD